MSERMPKRTSKGRTYRVWVALDEEGKPWIAHCRRRKKDIGRTGAVREGEYLRFVDLRPVRATLTIDAPRRKRR